jgi:heat shock protein HtpX
MLVAGTILFAFYSTLAMAFVAAGVGLGTVLAGTVLFVSIQYKLGTWLALRSVGAEQMQPVEYPYVHETASRLATEMGIDEPRLMIGQMGTPNAFAVGRKGSSTVVLSVELLEVLDEAELEAVLAHEFAHVKNRDVIVLLLGQAVASMIGITVAWLAGFVKIPIIGRVLGWFVSVFAHVVVMVFVLVISRHREYVADADAATYADGPALARALDKIMHFGRERPDGVTDTSYAALCIFGGTGGILSRLLSTHPPMEKRIKKLSR